MKKMKFSGIILFIQTWIFLLPGLLISQSQTPINIIFDMHADPFPQTSYSEKLSYYNLQLENGNWVLDQSEALGAEISFLSVGEFMEFVTGLGPDGDGANFVRRIYANGEQVASHSHSEYHSGNFDWASFPEGATYEQCKRSWQDNIDWVNSGILTALGTPPPKPLEEINAVKGAHIPKDGDQYQSLMEYFGLEARQGGPEEDFVGIYNHYIMNPFRPSAANPMQEDLDASFVAIPQGAVIGVAGIHHGIFQDMTAPNVKRMFIQTYLNWRYCDRHGLDQKVWAFGWGSHTSDYQPGSRTRTDMVEMINWLHDNFVGRADATGSVMAEWNTQKGAADEYAAWEIANPGKSSFNSNGTHLDWKDYQYLRAVCTELWESVYVEELNLGQEIRAWHLKKGPKDIVVAFCDGSPVTLNLSGLISYPCRIVRAENGLQAGVDPKNVAVGNEPVIVTEIAPTVGFKGVPSPGQTVTVTIFGAPDAVGSIYLAAKEKITNIPYVGTVLIDPDKGLKMIGSGKMTGGQFAVSMQIPSNPSLVGRTFYVQGLEKRENGSTVTVNSIPVTIVENIVRFAHN